MDINEIIEKIKYLEKEINELKNENKKIKEEIIFLKIKNNPNRLSYKDY